MIVRRALPGDVDALLEVKAELRLAPGEESASGGFLLGSSREQYVLLVERAEVHVLQDASTGEVGGFVVALPDPVLRAGELWSRREAIRWEGVDPGVLEGARVAYLDQMAVRTQRRYRTYAGALAVSALAELVRSGHQHLFATVVVEPVRNLASLPFLRALGARRVGEVEEEYEGVGRVLSGLYHTPVSREALEALLTLTPGGRRAGRTLRHVARHEGAA